MRPTMREMMRKVMIKCPTRRDMCVQEVMHLLLQVPSVDHDLEFVRARSETTSVELVEAGANGGLVGRRDLLQAYARRMHAWALTASGRPPVEECRSMPFSQSPDLHLNNGGRLVSHSSRNRVRSAPPSPATPGALPTRIATETAWSGSDLERAPCTSCLLYTSDAADE